MKIGNLEVYGIIYKIKNKINEKVYIGQTTDKRGFNGRYHCVGSGIERVYNYHFKRRCDNTFYNEHLLRSMEKYGLEAFEVTEIIDIAFSQYELDIKEICWISYFDSYKNGYNQTIGGSSGNKGYKHSDETKEKMKSRKYKHGANHSEAKKIICLNTLKIFDCMEYATQYYNCNAGCLTLCCQNKINYSGIYNDEKLTWMYYDDYLKSSADFINEKIYLSTIEKGIKVICLSTNKEFDNVKLASYFYDCDASLITKCCKLKRNFSGEFNGFPLVWRYYNDYLEMSEEQILNVLNKTNEFYNSIYKKVICLTSGYIFKTQTDAGKFYNCNSSSIGYNCKGKSISCGQLPDGTRLQWKYISDLTPEEYIKYDIKNKLKELYNNPTKL